MRGFRRMLWIETKLFLRDPFSVVFVFAFPLVVLLVLGSVFGDQPDPDFRGASGVDYHVAGYLAVVIAAVGLIGLPVHLAAYRERGILRRYRASGIPAWVVFGTQVVVNSAMAALGGLWLIVVAALVYDVSRPNSILGVVVAFAIGALSFIAVGFLLAAV